MRNVPIVYSLQSTVSMRDHSKLRAFELADRLALAVYEHTRGFPREEIFGLTAQLRRAAVSVPSNIVEGCARNSQADYLHFLDVAYASSREVEYQLSVAARLGYLEGQANRQLSELCVETSKVLAGLIHALRSE
jgi:four helix bundle protein